MIDRLRDEDNHQILQKVNELVDAVNELSRPRCDHCGRPASIRDDGDWCRDCYPDSQRMDLLVSLINDGARLLAEDETDTANYMLDEGLVSIRESDGYWQITDAGRRRLREMG